ncbi:hypothetical protein C8R45DRAFT_1179180 [Mycena sanguinolenta]|nr:hypothetical protein C8R45DRAFT_1179180 [Mycena sanguinolenta]
MPEPLRPMGKQTKLAYGLAMVVVQEQKRLCGSRELGPIARFGSNLQVVAKSSMFVALEHVIHRALLCRQTRHALCALESCVVRRDTAYPATAWDTLRQPTYLGRAFSIILGAISLIPYNRYILWSLGLASLVLYAAGRQRPSNKLRPLQASIDSVEETLELAKAGYPRSYVDLMDLTSQLYDVQHQVPTAGNTQYFNLENFVQYVRHSIAVWRSIHQCEKKATEVRTSILCIIEAERQRGLSDEIQTSREILSSLTRRASTVNRRIQPIGSYESILRFLYMSVAVLAILVAMKLFWTFSLGAKEGAGGEDFASHHSIMPIPKSRRCG